MLLGKGKESSFRFIEDSENPPLPLLVVGRLIRWREGLLEVVQEIVEDNPQLVRDLVHRETFLNELGHVLPNLGGSGDDVAERFSEVVYLLLYVEFTCSSVEILIGHFQDLVRVRDNLLPRWELSPAY